MKRLLTALLVSFALSIELTATCKVTKITQSMIPYTITHSGRYQVCEELYFDGTNPTPANAAITVEANNVQIFLNNHSITLTNDAIGILAVGFSELLIANDAISNVTLGNNGAGIALFDYSKVILRNLMTADTNGNSQGLYVQNCSDVTAKRCSFLASDSSDSSSGAQVVASSSVTFEECLFNLSSVNSSGLIIQGTTRQRCSDCKIISCSFENAGGNNLLVNGNDGLLIMNTSFSRQINDASLVALQDATSSRFEGCTFISQSQFTNMLRFIQGCSGLIIDSCLFDGQPATVNATTLLNLEVGTKDIYVTGSTFNGNSNVASAGIFIGGDNVLIENSLVQGLSGVGAFGIRTSGTGCTISSCTVNNNSVGVFAAPSGSSTKVFDCTISNNPVNGIRLESSFNVVARNTVTQNGISDTANIVIFGNSNSIIRNTVSGGAGDGIRLDGGAGGAQFNTLQYNTVHSNATIGINDTTATTTTTNQIYYNTSYNNGGGLLNYTVAPITIVQPQGACTLETANINGGLGTVTPISCP